MAKKIKNNTDINFDKSLADLLKEPVDLIRTGCTVLDKCLGGGFQKGRIINVIGDSSSGKSLLVQTTAGKFQKQYKNGIVVYDEGEGGTNAKRMVAVHKLDPNRTKVPSSKSIEKWFCNILKYCNVAEKLNIPIMYVTDSLDSMDTETTILDENTLEKIMKNNDMDKVFSMHKGLNKARLMSEFMKQINRRIRDSGMTLLIVSQTRIKIGVVFGDNTTINGGKALIFYCQQRIKLSESSKIKDTTSTGKIKIIGVNINVRVIKNRVIEPFHYCSFPCYFDKGIDDVEANANFIKDNSRIIKKKRIEEKWYSGSFSGLIEKARANKKLRKLLKHKTQEIWEKEYKI
jgi:recombination protein RecA